MIRFFLPWPPSVNDYWLACRGSYRRRISDRGQSFRLEVLSEVRKVFRGKAWPGPICVRIRAHPPADHRKHDLDNLLKATLDAMQKAGVYKDDSQIYFLSIERQSSLAELADGGLMVEVVS